MSIFNSSKSRTVDYLVVGGGLAGASAAETLRREGASGSVLLMCSEATPPYYRPPLSKRFLLGHGSEEGLLVHSPDFYEAHDIELALGMRATALDGQQRVVTTSPGLQIGYEKLLVATGSVPKRCAAPGADLSGIYYLRTIGDCRAIRSAISPEMNVAVLGASFLGMEIAVSLAELGIRVTVIERKSAVLPHLEVSVLSDHFRAYAIQRGITVLLDDTVAAFRGVGRVEELETVSGLHMPCDLVVVSIGVSPATDFLQGSTVMLESGRLAVDEFLRTSDPNVYGAGDVVDFYDPVFAKRRHIEHLDNAIKQGQLAAKNMLGRRQPYNDVSYFFCQIGDVGFNVLWQTEGATERISRGSLTDSSFATFYLKDDVLRGLFSLGRPADETRLSEEFIRYRVNLRRVKHLISDPGAALGDIPTQTVLILQGGGALGAFECGVVKAMEEEQIFPDIVAGVSIGAVNGAIIAANPRNATHALEAFWADLEVPTPCFPMLELRRTAATAGILSFGIPQFFRPRWMPPFDGLNDAPWNWKSYYDPSALKELISEYVDFGSLRTSPVRLLVGAVNVMTGELEVFDSYVDELSPDHILASGSLPPGFPWTIVDGAAYWDGGIVSNSPLDIVLDRCGVDGKHLFIVDLFSGNSPLPNNLMEIMARRDEIVYSERVRSDLRIRELVDSYRRLVDGILSQIGPADSNRIKHWPTYIQLMGNGAPMNITRIVRPRSVTDSPSRDYDFSEISIRANVSDGYELTKRMLAPGQPSLDLSGHRKPNR